MMNPLVTKHEQRIKTIQDALVTLQGLPVDPARQQLVLVIEALLEEVILLHSTISQLPLPSWSKFLD
jgi:nitrate reductase NapAB chaperone NapD